MKHIDAHCHCRDGKESYKTTIRKVSETAKSQGIAAILDMPPFPILTEKDVRERLKLAERRKPVVEYFLYVAVTADENQIKEAVRVVNAYPKVVGLKLRTTETAGFPGVSREKDQQKIYRVLAELDYRGVLAVHCEKESEFKPELWNPRKPWTHSSARPPRAEIASVNDQIKFAKKAKFKGKIHFTHLSCPESVISVQRAKKELDATCGITPHHFIFSWEDHFMESKDGLLHKVNPPLRDRKRADLLSEYLKQGRVDIYESDFAPHAQEEKFSPPYPSGIIIYLFQAGLIWLRQQGVSEETIEKLTYWNVKKLFGEKLKGV